MNEENNKKYYSSKKERKKDKRKRRRWRKVIFFTIIVAVLALILAYYFGFLENLGLGSGTDFLRNNSNNNPTNEAPMEAEQDVDESNIIFHDIRIQEDIIFLNDQEILLEHLEEKLLSLANDHVEFNLIDNVAIDSVYREVEAILKKNNLNFNTREDGTNP